MGIEVEGAFIGVGCNRVVGAADWGPSNLVAYGAHCSVAIFSPSEAKILVTLPGHKDHVNCVRWLPIYLLSDTDGFASDELYLLSGSADGDIFMWAYICSKNEWRTACHIPKAHGKAVTCIASVMVSPKTAMLASTSSDSSVRIWHVSVCAQAFGNCSMSLMQIVNVGSRLMVASSLTVLPGNCKGLLLALGGLDSQVHLYVGSCEDEFKPACKLKGHQDWIRSLDFADLSADGFGSLFLASCSQDKTIRIWKISVHELNPANLEGQVELQLSLKAYISGPVFKASDGYWQVSLESLLIGHEDWVYSVRWQPHVSLPAAKSLNQPCGQVSTKDGQIGLPLCVLSASMDRTMMIWKPDFASGIWMNKVTVGELSHTALGFYGGVWSPQGDAILAHGYGGSLHLWKNVGCMSPEWVPQLVPSGHSKPVIDIAWAKTAQFLLSVSHDQTARLFAFWDWSKRDVDTTKKSWHEIARPQVHGHDFNCVAIIKGPGNHCYVSGADEKVSRVFEAPGALLDSLTFTSGGTIRKEDELNRDTVQMLGANMSALGLSQKPIYSHGQTTTAEMTAGVDSGGSGLDTMDAFLDASPVVLTEPPLEEHLSRNTLWPELHKLYGHGNELFSMCSDHTGRFLATACKAQSASAAEIWLWEVRTWRSIGQLKSHTLTVTQMSFSHNDSFLLSVSRDRHISLFKLLDQEDKKEAAAPYKLVAKVEAHKRIIWTCSWSHCDRFFATGSRDKVVKIWAIEYKDVGLCVQNILTLPIFRSSVTAMSWSPKDYLLAIGMEDGQLELWGGVVLQRGQNSLPQGTSNMLSSDRWNFDMQRLHKLDINLCHVATVHRLVWRDVHRDVSQQGFQLASCGGDHSVRVFNVRLSSE